MAELPYKGNEISMIVIAPDSYNGLKKLEDMLTVENLQKSLIVKFQHLKFDLVF